MGVVYQHPLIQYSVEDTVLNSPLRLTSVHAALSVSNRLLCRPSRGEEDGTQDATATSTTVSTWPSTIRAQALAGQPARK